MLHNLAEHPKTWSRYEESYHIYYRYSPVHFEHGERIEEQPKPEVAREIKTALIKEAHNKEVFSDNPLLKYIPRKLLQRQLTNCLKKGPIRLVEKTPANVFRIKFLAELFPDGLFILLIRRAEDVISSLMEGWTAGRCPLEVTPFVKWHYIAPPGWRAQTERPLEEKCAFQWTEANRIAWRDLNEYCAGRFILVRHEDALARPLQTYVRIREFCQLPPSRFFDLQVARTNKRFFTHGGSKPRPEKWKELHKKEVESVRHIFKPLMEQFYADEPAQ
jgi:hypothetical protein